jgi:hypothetical protein
MPVGRVHVESGLREIGPAGHPLHVVAVKAGSIRDDRDWIAEKWRGRKDTHLREWRARSPRLRRFTTSSGAECAVDFRFT